jgi:hypothetical protein
LFWANALVCFQLSTERKDGPGLLAFSVLALVSLGLLSVLSLVSPLMLSLVAWFDCIVIDT